MAAATFLKYSYQTRVLIGAVREATGPTPSCPVGVRVHVLPVAILCIFLSLFRLTSGIVRAKLNGCVVYLNKGSFDKWCKRHAPTLALTGSTDHKIASVLAHCLPPTSSNATAADAVVRSGATFTSTQSRKFSSGSMGTAGSDPSDGSPATGEVRFRALSAPYADLSQTPASSNHSSSIPAAKGASLQTALLSPATAALSLQPLNTTSLQLTALDGQAPFQAMAVHAPAATTHNPSQASSPQ